MLKRIMLLKACAFLAAFALGGCSWSVSASRNYRVSARIHQSVPASGLQRARVTNVSGRIEVRGWNRPDVDVNALVHATDDAALHKITISVERSGDELVIRPQYPRSFLGFGSRADGSVDIQIHVPEHLAVSAGNVSGDVAVSGVRNDVDAGSVSGDVEVTDVNGSLDLKTTSGNIDGSVRALDRSRHLKAASVSGDISLRIPKNAGVNVSVHSVSGDFSSNFALPKSDSTVGTNVSGQINGGDAPISFSTVSGSMKLTGY